MYLLIKIFTNKLFKIRQLCHYLSLDMEAIHQVIPLNYTYISAIIQAELDFLSKVSGLMDDEQFRQSITEVIYSLNDLSDTVNLQRRYLSPRA